MFSNKNLIIDEKFITAEQPIIHESPSISSDDVTNEIIDYISPLVSETADPNNSVEICLKYLSLSEDKKIRVKRFFLDLVDSFQLDESNPYIAGQSIKSAFYKLGWKYNADVFRLDEMFETKSGNCFGLTLLIGAILESKGFQTEYLILANPDDSISQEDTKMLEELEYCNFFTRENPQLFCLQTWYLELAKIDRPNRFGLAEHPVLFHDGKILETTNFGTDDYEGWQPAYKIARKLNFEQLASVLFVENLRMDPLTYEKLQREESRNTTIRSLRQAINIWPENYEAYCDLNMIARDMGDKDLETESFVGLEKLENRNARYYWSRYILTNNIEDLCKSYELCPTAAFVYLEYSKKTSKSIEERRFDLAVVSYMVAFSSEMDLKRFYSDEKKYIIDLFGKDYYKQLMKKL